MDLWNAVVQGVLVGGLYTATGLGLMLVFGVLRLVNLAHGELVLLGAYLAYVICDVTSFDPLLRLPLVASWWRPPGGCCIDSCSPGWQATAETPRWSPPSRSH